MANATKLFKNGAYLQSSTTLFLFFASWGVWWSYYQIWLTSKDTGLGLNGEQVGTIYSANSFATLLVMFLYGTIQDKLGLKRHLTILSSAVMACLAPFFIFVYEPLLRHSFGLGVIVGAIFLPVAYMAAAGLLEAVSERMSRTYGFDYGQARGWGSLGYAVAALLASVLFGVSPVFCFIGGSIFGVLCLLVQLFWKTDKVPLAPGHSDHPKTPSLREMVGVLKMRNLWTIIAFVILSWTFYNLYDQQMFPDFYTSLFESKKQGEQVYGVLNAIQVFVEGGMMMLVPILMRKVGVRTTLLLGVSVMCLRILGSAVFDDPTLVSIVKMFHAVEVPLFILGIFRYITLHFPANLSATLYLVGFEVSAQVGNVLLSRPFGSLRDAIGYQHTFYVISGAVFLAGCWAYFALKRDDQEVYGDPIVHDSQRAQVVNDPA